MEEEVGGESHKRNLTLRPCLKLQEKTGKGGGGALKKLEWTIKRGGKVKTRKKEQDLSVLGGKKMKFGAVGKYHDRRRSEEHTVFWKKMPPSQSKGGPGTAEASGKK